MSNDERRPETDPESYYDDYGHREWERLDRDFHHRLEFEGTVEYLERYLPGNGHVLDAGGGAGRYAVWLAERGYDVTLVDLSETQVEIAAEKAAERGLDERVRTERGDVRDLDFESDSFDATLCLGGPVSHVLDEDEREMAASELGRVTKPNAPVFVSVMGLVSAVMATVQHAGRVDEELDDVVLLPDLVEHGDYTGELAARHGKRPVIFDCHFFRVDELEGLLEAAGLTVEAVAGLEGVASQRRDAFDALDEAKRDAIESVVDAFREDRTVADLSSHMLAVGTTG